ncbi:MAG: homoserine kinase [Gemmatimonadaceae bacterium]
MKSKPLTTARVRAPASTSNLGAGFDCVGVAVDRWLSASVEVSDKSSSVTMTRGGAIARLSHDAEGDLVHVGFRLACDACDRPVPRGVAYDVTSTIPVARGLGASAAALVAGAFLAKGSLDLDLDPEAIATLCARYEGHPDNAAPSVFGGAMLGIPVDNRGKYAFARLRIHAGLALVFAVPDLELLTSEARAVLPKTVSHAIAVTAAAKSAALIEGMSSGDKTLLSFALDDLLHVPFRRQLMPGYDSIVDAAVKIGAFGATLSGSGSTIVAVAPRATATKVGVAMQSAWQSLGHAAEVIVTDKMVDGAVLE